MRSVKDVELPAADQPTPAEEKALAKCVSADLYFGFGQPADPVKARKCAYAEIDRDAKAADRRKSHPDDDLCQRQWRGAQF